TERSPGHGERQGLSGHESVNTRDLPSAQNRVDGSRQPAGKFASAPDGKLINCIGSQDVSPLEGRWPTVVILRRIRRGLIGYVGAEVGDIARKRIRNEIADTFRETPF